MDRAYEYNKILVLVESHGFIPVVFPKKNRKYHWLYDKQLYKQQNIIEKYFLHLKCFKKVFTRYDKPSSIFIFAISPAFIFYLLFM